MVVRFLYFARCNVVARTRIAFQCATDARITINNFYCRSSHICVLVKICRSL